MQHYVSVIHVYRDGSQRSSFSIEKEVSGNLLIIKISYKQKFLKYWFSAQAMLRAISIVKRDHGKIDRVFLNVFYPLGAHLWWLKAKISAPIYAIEHWTGFHSDTPVYNRDHPHLKIARWASRYCTKVIAVSNNLSLAMTKQGLNNVNGVVYNTVDEGIFYFEPKNDETTFTLLHISSLKDEHKNFSLLLRAFAVSSQNKAMKLVVINSGACEPYQSLIDELGIQSRIEFKGKKSINEVAKIMKQCQAFVLSSNYENMPCVIEEALCCGLPVVSTSVGGIEEIVNNRNGFLVPKQNAVALSKAMDELVIDYLKFNREEIAKQAIAKFGKKAVLCQMEKELAL